ncbi:hypothetical protein BDV19DRAFT_369907 [Aspergillus venezuelensis]
MMRTGWVHTMSLVLSEGVPLIITTLPNSTTFSTTTVRGHVHNPTRARTLAPVLARDTLPDEVLRDLGVAIAANMIVGLEALLLGPRRGSIWDTRRAMGCWGL